MSGKKAARLGDIGSSHGCFPPTPILSGSSDILINNRPAARKGDPLLLHGCGTCPPHPRSISAGSSTVMLNGKPAARVGDAINCGGKISMGSGDVIIGDQGLQAPDQPCLEAAKAAGSAFVHIYPESSNVIEHLPPPPGLLASLISAQNSGSPVVLASPSIPEKQSSIKKIKSLISLSPTLQKGLKELKKNNWQIKEGEPNEGSYANKKSKVIVIDKNIKSSPERYVQTLAHELGHALYTADPYVDMSNITKQDYINRNAIRHLKDEGEATLVNIEIRDEILHNGGPDIGIAGTQSEKYINAYSEYQKSGDREAARESIANIFADNERPSTDPSKTYRQYYGESYEVHWDKYNRK